MSEATGRTTRSALDHVTPQRFVFIGVTTGGSAIMRVFPAWAEQLALGNVVMHGCDLPLNGPPSRYREVVARLKADPLDLGALITTHKLDLFAACRDLFDEIDLHSELSGEVSCLAKRDGVLRAHAKDPISSGRALGEFAANGHWEATDAHALLLGAGGANLAITLHLMTGRPPLDRPRRIVVVDRSAARLDSMRAVHAKLDGVVEVDYVHADAPNELDSLLESQPPGSLVVNGTGMGKDVPGSPISDRAHFPPRALVWELNYRGEREFLRQAQRQRESSDLRIEDGWRYFVHSWTCVIEEVFGVEMTPGLVDELSRLAERSRTE